MRKKWQIILALILLAVSLTILYFWKNSDRKLEEKISIWLAGEDIPAGAPVEDYIYEKVEINKGVLSNIADMTQDYDDMYFSHDMFKGDPLLRGSFTDKKSMNKKLIAKDGKQLYSLYLKADQANGNCLYEDCLVDIYINFPSDLFSDKREDEREYYDSGQIVIKEVRLVKHFMETEDLNESVISNPQIFIFEVSPEEISILNSARHKNAFIALALRNN